MHIFHDDVIKWKYFLCYWPFVQGVHRSPVNSPHKGQWHGALMFSLICTWINGWVNNHEARDLICNHAHYDVIVMAMFQVSALIVQWHRKYFQIFYENFVFSSKSNWKVMYFWTIQNKCVFQIIVYDDFNKIWWYMFQVVVCRSFELSFN